MAAKLAAPPERVLPAKRLSHTRPRTVSHDPASTQADSHRHALASWRRYDEADGERSARYASLCGGQTQLLPQRSHERTAARRPCRQEIWLFQRSPHGMSFTSGYISSTEPEAHLNWPDCRMSPEVPVRPAQTTPSPASGARPTRDHPKRRHGNKRRPQKDQRPAGRRPEQETERTARNGRAADLRRAWPKTTRASCPARTEVDETRDRSSYHWTLLGLVVSHSEGGAQ
jgi:hypothetical protein